MALTSLVTTGLAAIGTRSLRDFSRHELEEICRRRRSPERLGQILRSYDQAALSAETLQVFFTAAFVGSTALWFAGQMHEPGWLSLASSAVLGAVLLLAAEIWFPWAIARLWAEPFLYFSWPLWRVLSALLSPLAMGAWFVDTILHRLAGRVHEEPDEESFEDEIRTVVTEGHREGLLEEDAREMIEGVIELGDVDVSEIMTPRTDMVSISKSLSWQEALEAIIKVGHTRLPVYDRNRDDIVGMLYIKDLLPELAKGPEEPIRPWTDLLREPYFVPETKPVDVLLQEFQLTRNHMAVVLDEYGGVSGLITLEDVLEEIVGEIVDESDKDLVDGIRQIDSGVAEVLGKVHIYEINERLNLELPEEEDFDTIGGMVFSHLGHVPVPGEEVVFGNVRITVVEATRRRIERVRIEVLDQSHVETA
jgi:CBS domain containing-hemolysin-like protein